MKFQIALKLFYLLDNFESIDNFVFKVKRLRQNKIKYILEVKYNGKFLTKKELKSELINYFDKLPINFIIK